MVKGLKNAYLMHFSSLPFPSPLATTLWNMFDMFIHQHPLKYVLYVYGSTALLYYISESLSSMCCREQILFNYSINQSHYHPISVQQSIWNYHFQSNYCRQMFTLPHLADSVRAPALSSSRQSIFPVFPHIQTPLHLQKVHIFNS